MNSAKAEFCSVFEHVIKRDRIPLACSPFCSFEVEPQASSPPFAADGYPNAAARSKPSVVARGAVPRVSFNRRNQVSGLFIPASVLVYRSRSSQSKATHPGPNDPKDVCSCPRAGTLFSTLLRRARPQSRSPGLPRRRLLRKQRMFSSPPLDSIRAVSHGGRARANALISTILGLHVACLDFDAQTETTSCTNRVEASFVSDFWR